VVLGVVVVVPVVGASVVGDCGALETESKPIGYQCMFFCSKYLNKTLMNRLSFTPILTCSDAAAYNIQGGHTAKCRTESCSGVVFCGN